MKKILIAILILAVAFGIYLMLSNMTPETSGPTPGEYKSELGYSFKYRDGADGYILQKLDNTSSFENLAEAVIMMQREDYDSILRGEREGGEGPPVITVLVFNNPENLAPRAWLEANPQISNIGLKTSEPEEVTISGQSVLVYEADGLYPSRNAIFVAGNRVYMLTGQYFERDSALYRDFTALLESFEIGQ